MGKVVLITGGTNGIGKAMMIDLLKGGYKVATFSRNEKKCGELREELGLEFDKKNFLIEVGDVTSEKDIDKMYNLTKDKFDTIDILINNAGYGFFIPADEVNLEDYKDMMNTNVHGLAAMTKKVIPWFKERTDGLIINIASIAGKRVFGVGSFYSSTKFAVMGYSEGIRNELKPYGIKVCTICPGMIKTDFFSDEEIEKRKEALGREVIMLEPEDISRVVTMICSQSKNCSIEDITIMPMLN